MGTLITLILVPVMLVLQTAKLVKQMGRINAIRMDARVALFTTVPRNCVILALAIAPLVWLMEKGTVI